VKEMEQKLSTLSSFIKFSYLYPILISLFPIIALYNHNIEYVHYTSIYRSVKITLVAIGFVLLISNFILRDPGKSAVVGSFFILLFFLYGHLFTWIQIRLPNRIQNRHLTAFWAALLLIGMWIIIKKTTRIKELNKFLSVVSLALICIGLYSAVSFEVQKMLSNRQNLETAMTHIGEQFNIQVETLPDIYYIILDAHTRSDVLQKHFGYDNTAMITELEDLGFYVAKCSQSNYWRTEYSLTSVLNLDYIHNFVENPTTLPDWSTSLVRQTLNQLGYTTVGFESRATHNVDLGVDIFLSKTAEPDIYEDIYPFTNLNEFEVMLIKTSWLQSWLQLLANFQRNLPENMILDAENAGYFEHYRQTLYILDELQRVPYLESPKFVMAHLLVPHEPFIFRPDGKYEYHHTDEEFTIGYRNNSQFIDDQIPKVISNIIARSRVPPIIIVQGDHGPNGSPPDMLLPILNAYYFPGVDQEVLYPQITPVNTYRLVFNNYFGSDYPLLEDISYYSTQAEFMDYQEFPNTCP
jgi:hypothetical protein